MPAEQGDWLWLRSRPTWILLAIGALYALAINPYFVPETYDNIVYFFGARSLLEDGSFKFDGSFVVDWPPGLSALLAAAFAVTGPSVVVAKTMIAASVVIALMACHRLAVRDGRTAPLATTAIFGLVPAAYLVGTRIMAEWPFIAASFLFLLVLHRLDERWRTAQMTIAAGLLLGAASLTRHAGVLLGLSLVTQAIARLRRDRSVRAIAPEVIAASIGGAAFLAWRWKLARQLAEGTASVRYQGDASFLTHLDLRVVPTAIADLLVKWDSVSAAAHLGSGMKLAIALVPTALIVAGFVHRARTRITPSDTYALASLALFATLEWKHTRYVVPMAPFLIAYLLDGVRIAAARIVRSEALRTRAGNLTLAAWLLGLVALDGVVLVRGNGRTYGGLAFLVSRDARSFYRGEWRALYEASEWLAHEPAPGAVAVAGSGNRKYVLGWSGRRTLDYPADAGTAFVLSVDPFAFAPDDPVRARLVEERTFESVHVYRLPPARGRE